MGYGGMEMESGQKYTAYIVHISTCFDILLRYVTVAMCPSWLQVRITRRTEWTRWNRWNRCASNLLRGVRARTLRKLNVFAI